MEKREMDIYDKVIEIFKKILLIGIGMSLLAVGLVSLFFPFSPGLFMIFLGLTFCAKGSESIARSYIVIKALKFLSNKLILMKDSLARMTKFFK